LDHLLTQAVPTCSPITTRISFPLRVKVMHLSEINIYPIKSLAGIPLDEALVEDRGLQFDRRWMLVDGDRKFITQREVPKMALVKIAVDPDGLTASVNGDRIHVTDEQTTGETAIVDIWTSSVKGAF